MMKSKSKLQNHRMNKSWTIQLTAIILYAYILLVSEHAVVQDYSYKLGYIDIALVVAYAINLAIMVAVSWTISALLIKKPPKNKFAPPTGIEQFNLPTAEEGRPIQVLFGKKYITGPNVVWYGDLKSEAIQIRA